MTSTIDSTTAIPSLVPYEPMPGSEPAKTFGTYNRRGEHEQPRASRRCAKRTRAYIDYLKATAATESQRLQGLALLRRTVDDLNSRGAKAPAANEQRRESTGTARADSKPAPLRKSATRKRVGRTVTAPTSRTTKKTRVSA